MITASTGPLLTVKTMKGTYVVKRPDKESVEKTKDLAKQIFVEAFSSTYKEYYRKSGDVRTIAQWLVLKDGLTLESWLNNTFDGEYQEYLEGTKEFVHLYDEKQNLVGWLSHGPVSKTGEMYLSQCSLEANHRGQKIATEAFKTVLKTKAYETVFPGVKQIKLIARRINEYAERLYKGAGFIQDLQIDPKTYGESYNDRYVGYRKEL